MKITDITELVENLMEKEKEVADRADEIKKKAGHTEAYDRERKELESLYPIQFAGGRTLMDETVLEASRSLEKLLNTLVILPESLEQHFQEFLKIWYGGVPFMIDDFNKQMKKHREDLKNDQK